MSDPRPIRLPTTGELQDAARVVIDAELAASIKARLLSLNENEPIDLIVEELVGSVWRALKNPTVHDALLTVALPHMLFASAALRQPMDGKDDRGAA